MALAAGLKTLEHRINIHPAHIVSPHAQKLSQHSVRPEGNPVTPAAPLLSETGEVSELARSIFAHGPQRLTLRLLLQECCFQWLLSDRERANSATGALSAGGHVYARNIAALVFPGSFIFQNDQPAVGQPSVPRPVAVDLHIQPVNPRAYSS